jgi:hypothetical protein
MKLDFSNNPVFIGLSRKSVRPEMAKRLAQAWKKLAANDEIIQLYRLYGLSYKPYLSRLVLLNKLD